MKTIYDPIHKYMEFDDVLTSILDTPDFQKLRNIKQLGLCHYIFPGATHTRFEHSLGVCHLSGKMLDCIKNNQPELNITDRQILLVKIAGLVHDIGHVCFSHFFDDHFLKDKLTGPYTKHEFRSCALFEYIVKKYKIKLTPSEITTVKKMIDPPNNSSFLYQIVCNKKNGLDCDKFDYLKRDTYNLGLAYTCETDRLIKQARVINGQICFNSKCHFDIMDLFYTRYKLHKLIYTHPKVRAIEYMILDILNIGNEKLKLVKMIQDVSAYRFLTDNILDLVYYFDIKPAITILDNIKSRKLYKLVPEETNNAIKDNFNLNYSREENNPLDYVFLYNNKGYIVNNDKLSGLTPGVFQEKICRFYTRE